MTLLNNQFLDNEATVSGGALKIILILPINDLLQENNFQGNKAFYGPNIGAFFTSLALKVSTEGNKHLKGQNSIMFIISRQRNKLYL